MPLAVELIPLQPDRHDCGVYAGSSWLPEPRYVQRRDRGLRTQVTARRRTVERHLEQGIAPKPCGVVAVLVAGRTMYIVAVTLFVVVVVSVQRAPHHAYLTFCL